MEKDSVIQHIDESETAIAGEVIYVPIYSSIFYVDSKKTINLAATLSIHNTDLEKSIVLDKVWYYDLKGRLLKKYNTEKIQLQPLETLNFVIAENDKSGGTGANFIIEWISETEVSSPIVEAVMINTKHSVGISFISSGKVIKKIEQQK